MCRNLTQMEHADEVNRARATSQKQNAQSQCGASIESTGRGPSGGVKAAEQATKAKIKASARIVAILPAS